MQAMGSQRPKADRLPIPQAQVSDIGPDDEQVRTYTFLLWFFGLFFMRFYIGFGSPLIIARVSNNKGTYQRTVLETINYNHFSISDYLSWRTSANSMENKNVFLNNEHIYGCVLYA